MLLDSIKYFCLSREIFYEYLSNQNIRNYKEKNVFKLYYIKDYMYNNLVYLKF